MDRPLWQRRQLLYAGLAGASAAIAYRLGSPRSPVTTSAEAGTESAVDSDRPAAASLEPSGDPMPELRGISQWLNSEPLTIASLKGSVVLLQFWTFGCINCQRTLPSLVGWHRRYADRGLKIIGVHTPEFAYERDVNNIRRALSQHDITYPVPLDNDFQTWRAYSNRYWPHLFLADRDGFLRYDHIGEGAYDTTEQTIRALLG
ncbi:thioredoxin family protein [Leptolyngbya sp. CCNP1308]|uniref:thioredoxin family protein n=1 Tax=Leptolyngbya sp. CCNP1308 TaxID=3110255 RepID=UPI002B1EAC4F|nr:thioredoxin family protein [Leptolyngbya sp. CCNP1308]MEA5451270.1 thioredoxin family protein [Leptolyngbya sp. CCNP1308]